MDWPALKNQIKNKPIFTSTDVIKWFPNESENQIAVQLSRFISASHLTLLRNGLYLWNEYPLSDLFILAKYLRSPSYISLETALNYYNLIPDIPASTTSITTKTTKTYETPLGKYIYRSIKNDLFFGYEHITVDKNLNLGYNIATPEKALLDYFYLNVQIDSTSELRLRELNSINFEKLIEYAELYDKRVKGLVEESIQTL